MKKLDKKTDKLLRRVGYPMTAKERKELGKHKVTLVPLLSDEERAASKAAVSNRMPSGALTNNDLLSDYKWRRGLEDTPEAIKAAHDKANRIAPAFNKGALMFLTDAALTPGQIDKAGKI